MYSTNNDLLEQYEKEYATCACDINTQMSRRRKSSAPCVGAYETRIDEEWHFRSENRSLICYHPDYSSLFAEYGNQIETDVQHSRMLEAKTAASRRNAMTFLGIVFVIFFLGYPKLSEFLTDASRIAFFATISIISVGGFAIWRTREKIEV